MMKPWRLLIAFSIVSLLMGVACAQETSETNDRLKQYLTKYPRADTDGDGVLTREEAQTFRRRPGITSPITGPRTVGHVESALRAAEVELTEEEMDRVDEVLAPVEALTEYFTLYRRMCEAVNNDEPLPTF